jgi:hypothetical protein
MLWFPAFGLSVYRTIEVPDELAEVPESAFGGAQPLEAAASLGPIVSAILATAIAGLLMFVTEREEKRKSPSS